MDRTKGIGGSDLAAIVNYYRGAKVVSSYKTALDIYHQKIGTYKDVDDNDYMLFGRGMESVIADCYLAGVRRTGSVVAMEDSGLEIVHKDFPFLIGHIDRWVTCDGVRYVLEIKTANWRMAKNWGEEGSDGIPDQYLFQVAYYRAISGVKRVDIALYGGEFPLRIYHYEQNIKLEESLIHYAKKFWLEHVVQKNPPEITAESDTKYIETRPIADRVLIINIGLRQIAEEMKEVTGKINELEVQKGLLRAKILSLMAENEKAVDNEGKTVITNKFQSSSRVDVDLLKKTYPDIYNAVLKKKECVVVRVY